MLRTPFIRKPPKSHEATSDGPSPPRVAIVRMMATGPVAAKMNPASALVAYTLPKSAMIRRRAGGCCPGRSIVAISFDRAGAGIRDGLVTWAL